MSYESYPVAVASDDHSLYEFTSVGPRGRIKKVVAFIPTEYPTVFSLAFGDLHPGSSVPDDMVVSDNGDRDKILATVAAVVDRYTQQYPSRWIRFLGSTEARTRLYRIAISRHLKELSGKYLIYVAFYGQPPQPFTKTKSFDFILIKRKPLTL